MASNYDFYESRGEYGRDNHSHRYGNPGNPPDDRERNRNGGHPYSGPPPINSSDSYPFFLAGDGIAREVIQTDIPRYLGNNAVCKPGNKQVCPESFSRLIPPLVANQLCTSRDNLGSGIRAIGR